MSAHSEWKDKLFYLVKEHLPTPSAEVGLCSDSAEAFKKEYEDEYRGAHLAMNLADLTMSASWGIKESMRIKQPNIYETYLYAWGPVPEWAWSTDTRILVTTEGFYFRQEVKKLFGNNKLNNGSITYKELIDERYSRNGDKLTFKVHCNFFLFDSLNEETIELPIAGDVYRFLKAAHNLYLTNSALYDAAIDEFADDMGDDDLDDD